MKQEKTMKSKARFCSICAMCTALYAVCSWISIPVTPPFTLQTFAIFTVTGLFGIPVALTAFAVYLFIGIIGLPVFAGFKQGLTVITGPTGGYLIGFAVSILVMGLIIKLFGRKTVSLFVSFAAGLLVVYIFGSVFYSVVWLGGLNPESFTAALTTCVVPFVLVDILKMCLAVFVTKSLEGKIRI